MEIEWTTKVIKQYPYRTAFVRKWFLKIERTPETIATFEAELARAAMSHVDNHTAYKLQTKEGAVFYIGCSDLTYYIGLEIDEHSW